MFTYFMVGAHPKPIKNSHFGCIYVPLGAILNYLLEGKLGARKTNLNQSLQGLRSYPLCRARLSSLGDSGGTLMRLIIHIAEP